MKGGEEIIYSLPHFKCQSLNSFKYQLIKSIKTPLEFMKNCLIAGFLPLHVFSESCYFLWKTSASLCPRLGEFCQKRSRSQRAEYTRWVKQAHYLQQKQKNPAVQNGPRLSHSDLCDIRSMHISEENKRGTKIALTPRTARRWLKERGFAFLCYEPMIR